MAGMMMKSSVSVAVAAQWKKSKLRTTAVAEDDKALTQEGKRGDELSAGIQTRRHWHITDRCDTSRKVNHSSVTNIWSPLFYFGSNPTGIAGPRVEAAGGNRWLRRCAKPSRGNWQRQRQCAALAVARPTGSWCNSRLEVGASGGRRSVSRETIVTMVSRHWQLTAR